MPLFGKITIDIYTERAAAVQDSRREKCFTASLDALLQILLNAILFDVAQGANGWRQKAETTDRGFDFAGAFEV